MNNTGGRFSLLHRISTHRFLPRSDDSPDFKITGANLLSKNIGYGSNKTPQILAKTKTMRQKQAAFGRSTATPRYPLKTNLDLS